MITGHKTDSMHLRYLIRNEQDMRRELEATVFPFSPKHGQSRDK
jgi:hypothetical protein